MGKNGINYCGKFRWGFAQFFDQGFLKKAAFQPRSGELRSILNSFVLLTSSYFLRITLMFTPDCLRWSSATMWLVNRDHVCGHG
jgi:hypothetical protein